MLFLYQIFLALIYRIDVIQLCNPPDFLIFSTLGARILHNPYIVFDQHDVVPQLWIAKGYSQDSAFFSILNWLEIYTAKHCDLMICASESFREKVLRSGIKMKRDVRVVKTAPRANFGSEFRVQTGVPDIQTIGYLGRMGSQDGVSILLKAFSNLVKDQSATEIELILIGDGPERKALEAEAVQLGIREQVNFLGYIADENSLCEKLLACQLAVCPDMPNEMNQMASMNKITEYLALGLPIVLFDLRENVRTVDECSIIVKEPNPVALAEGMRSLLYNHDLRNTLSERSRQRFVQYLSWDRQEHKFISAYENLFSNFN